MYSVQCAECSVQCAVCSVQCAVCSLQFSVCSVQHDGVYLLQEVRVAMGEEQLDWPRLLPLQEVSGHQAISYSEEAEKVRAGGRENRIWTELHCISMVGQ